MKLKYKVDLLKIKKFLYNVKLWGFIYIPIIHVCILMQKYGFKKPGFAQVYCRCCRF